VTVPAVEGLLTAPYVTLAEFRANPTWLDTNNLITTPGATQAQQDAELYNVLLRASAWADNYCEQRLGAHTVLENTRSRCDRYGRMFLHPSNVPVRQITGLAYGVDFQNLTAITDFTQTWVEDARGIVVSIMPMRGSFSSLEFGGVPSGDTEIYVQYQYTAGYAATVLSAASALGANTLSVVDGTGLQSPSLGILGTLAGSTARIWDPNNEEAVTMGSSYVTGSSTLALASTTLFAHAKGVSVSELPAEVHQAVVSLAVALMTRENAEDDEPFAAAELGPSLRKSAGGGIGGGLVEDAWMLLDPFRRVR
jgi:hypothetical protein